MIFTVLYSSGLFENNKYRDTLLYSIGAFIYAIIHYFLFSMNNNASVQRYRYLLYLFVLGDMLYTAKFYLKKPQQLPKSSPIIEEVPEPQQKNHNMSVSHTNALSIKNTPHSTESNIKHNNSKETKSNVSIPVYTSVKNDTVKQDVIEKPNNGFSMEVSKQNEEMPTYKTNEKEETHQT